MSEVTYDKTELTRHFTWRTRKGEYVHPKDMETRHLFFTIRMIWNHYMPPRLQIHPFNRYKFSPFYTDDYMARALQVMLPELCKQERLAELKPWQISQIIWMANQVKDLHMNLNHLSPRLRGPERDDGEKGPAGPGWEQQQESDECQQQEEEQHGSQDR